MGDKNSTPVTTRNYPDPFDNLPEFLLYLQQKIALITSSHQITQDKIFEIFNYIQRRLGDINQISDYNSAQSPDLKEMILNELDCLFQEIEDLQK